MVHPMKENVFHLGYFTLCRLCEELRANWLGGRIHSACSTSSADFYFSGASNRVLFLSGRSPQARIADIQDLPLEPLQAPSWVARYIVGATVREIRLIGYEPIIRIDLIGTDNRGRQERTVLMVELMDNRQNNVFLVSGENGQIIASLRQSASSSHRTDKRVLGDVYRAPRTGKTTPMDLTPAILKDVLKDGDAATNLTRAISGMDPLVAQELILLTGFDPSCPVDSLQGLLDGIRHFFRAPPWADRPAVVNAQGVDDICVVNLERVGMCERIEFDTVSKAIAELTRRDQVRHEQLDEVEAIRRTLKRLVVSQERRIERARVDMESAEKIAESGNSAPGRNMKGCKLKRIAQRRMGGAQQERAELEQAIQALDHAEPVSVNELRAVWVKRGWLRSDIASIPAKPASTSQPRCYRTSNGWTVLVGRNSKENDRLTEASAKDDLFFHAQGVPGSHVILKTAGKTNELGVAAIKEAAGLAAYWSKARRDNEIVPVIYTEIRHVVKPPGAVSGQVAVQHEKVVFVSPQEIEKAEV
ncbi:MAG: DUF814 domain-containing protein [Candidatus Latescibacteria bacterium]|nr:DUF814 domain-containing protein [Candidatus Latescibacterota bacterium]